MNDEVFYEVALRYFANTASVEDEKLLKQYLSLAEYREKYRLLFETFQNESIKVTNEFSLERGLKILRRKIDQSEKINLFKYKKSIAIAASIVIFLGLGIFLNSVFFNTKITHYVSVTSPAGQRIKVLLPDSSSVYLNSETTIKYPEQFANDKRGVQLEGEAFFQVKKNVKKPFIVQSGNFTTTVLGTSFNVVNTDQNNFRVTVRTGKVKVENSVTKKQFILEKDSQVTLIAKSGELVKTTVNAKAITDWHENILRFDAITAKEAFHKMEQWYNVNIHCESNTILNRKIRAVYKNEPVEKVLKSLEFMIGLQYKIENDSISIK